MLAQGKLDQGDRYDQMPINFYFANDMNASTGHEITDVACIFQK